MARVFGAAALSLCCLLLAAGPGNAQSPPPADPTSAAAPPALQGLAQPFEINKIVRDAGFSPLGPPKREGTTYVLRAINSREILMRVVVDGRSGAIRAVNRIAAPRADGGVGMKQRQDGAQGPHRSLQGMPPYEPPARLQEASPHEPLAGPPPRDVPADAAPSDINGSPMSPKEADLRTPPSPLPRPRPSDLTMQKARPPAKMPKAPAVKPNAAPAAASVAPGAPRPAPAMPNGVPRIATPD